MPHSPAFPTSELTRHVVTPGLTAHEIATIAFMAALMPRLPRSDHPPLAGDPAEHEVIAEIARLAKACADAALAHRLTGDAS